MDEKEEHYVEEILSAYIVRWLLQYLVNFVSNDQTKWKIVEKVNEVEIIDVFFKY